ncbi:MAG TPA: 2-dehydropantoate 2-reductase [Burkholderiales bacterium]|jgi:2-dehydropantoate 2-reductase
MSKDSVSGLKVCVIGAGAIGGFFGAKLAQGHARVSVVARGATLQALRSKGWVLEAGGERIASPVWAEDDPATLGPQDVVILAVKSQAVEAAAQLVKPLLGPETLIVPALNGVPWWFTSGNGKYSRRLMSADPQGLIEAVLPAERVLGAVVYPACSTPEPGVTRLHSGSRVVFGEILAAKPSARLETWVDFLRTAGFEAEASTDIRAEVWRKLLGNACFNPLSLLTESATDDMIDDPAVHGVISSMMGEVLQVGRALGLAIDISVPDRIAVSRKLGHIKTSMLQDLEARRAVELDAILGTLLELAAGVEVAAPACATVFALARRRARQLGLMPG